MKIAGWKNSIVFILIAISVSVPAAADLASSKNTVMNTSHSQIAGISSTEDLNPEQYNFFYDCWTKLMQRQENDPSLVLRMSPTQTCLEMLSGPQMRADNSIRNFLHQRWRNGSATEKSEVRQAFLIIDKSVPSSPADPGSSAAGTAGQQ